MAGYKNQQLPPRGGGIFLRRDYGDSQPWWLNKKNQLRMHSFMSNVKTNSKTTENLM